MKKEYEKLKNKIDSFKKMNSSQSINTNISENIPNQELLFQEEIEQVNFFLIFNFNIKIPCGLTS